MASQGKKIAWVTGASTGIGAAVALDLARDGWTVIATARSAEKLERIARVSGELDGRVIPAVGDITDRNVMHDIVENAERTVGPIHLVILNAGIYAHETPQKFSAETFRTMVDLNLTGTAYCLEAVLPKLMERKRGHIAIVGSIAGFRGLPGLMGYGAAKAGLIHLAESLAVMCDKFNIKVQIINPGFVRTPLNDKIKFPMPFLMDVNEASKRIVQGLRRNCFEITFPKRLSYALKLLGLLPDRLYFFIIRRVTRYK